MNRKQRRAAAATNLCGATNLLTAALQHHQAGRLAAAEAGYRQLLAVYPAHADAYFNLGVALRQQGRLDDAVAAYRKSIANNPNHAEAHYNLGNVLMGQGRSAEAVEAFWDAIRNKPDHARAYSNLGVALKSQGKLDEAIVAYCKAIGIKPDYADAHSNLGNALMDQEKFEEAVTAYRQAIRLKPDTARTYFDLAIALTDQGELDEAIEAYRQAIGIKPDYAEAYFNLGNVLKGHGKLDEAVAAYRQATTIRMDFAEAHANLGNTFVDLGKLDDAVAAYRQAIDINPNNAEAYYNLGNALKDRGELDEAVAKYRQALVLKPDYAEAHCNLAIVLMDQSKIDLAVAEYRRAISLKPDYADAHSNLLFCLNYADAISSEEVYREAVCWNERYAFRYRPPDASYYNERSPDRRLRIGYVSPDFRAHSVAYFLEPLLKGHDRAAVEVFCYAEVARPDTVTAQLQGLADHWLMTVGLSDDELAERIRVDGIDILVDLAGHTAHNRLLVFARKPAPVQVTWLGYPNTTGLKAIDYRLVDAVTDPAGNADACASETLVRLAGGFLCYAGSKDAPEPADPPCLRTGTVTFGSFNNPAKASTATFDAWARLLTRLPEARLLLKGKSFADATTRALFIARLGERGVASQRVELVAWAPSSVAHLTLYDRIDIALDPFPYNGTTTTCEALWMGVPVVTLRGDRHAGRVGASLLSYSGLTDWIAGSVEDYVEIAVALAGNPGHLLDLRRSLRPRLAASPLCDNKAFASHIEAAFRTMWQRWQLNL
jgi:protein O-GlcNAc transferase